MNLDLKKASTQNRGENKERLDVMHKNGRVNNGSHKLFKRLAQNLGEQKSVADTLSTVKAMPPAYIYYSIHRGYTESRVFLSL